MSQRSKWFFFGGMLIGTIFTLYLASLYHQLTQAFKTENQFIPTRIYSDVTRIIPGQKRSSIETHLKNLGYSVANRGENLQFHPHPIDYPAYLIPDGHPLFDQGGDPAVLHFDSSEHNATLQSIEYHQQAIPDFYLEPELVATLSRGGDLVKQIRDPLKFGEIPAPVWKAIIAIEDQHFLDHRGLDPKGILRAIWVNFRTLSFAQGGSTITQQLVKNLMARRSKNIFRKINELFLALLLETSFSKEEILERYLNEVYLGQVGNLEVHGVSEGAEHFFGKKLEELNLAEIAMMAGLIRGPGYYSPYRYHERAVSRQRLVLQKMAETGQIASDEAKAALKLPIRLAPPQSTANRAPYFTDYVKAEIFRVLGKNPKETEILASGLRIYSTLDPYLNQIAQKEIASTLDSLDTRFKIVSPQRLEGALAAMDQSTGYIRALVGGRSYSQSTFNRILNMKRQIGSTFKPIVYLTALNQGKDLHGIPYGPAYPIEDAPWTLIFDQGRKSWSPKNYEKTHQGWISMRTALTQSVNTAAARLGFQVGLDQVAETAKRLGMESRLPLVPSLSLGVAEASPIEVLKVYGTLANRGTQDEPTVIRGITHSDGTHFWRSFFHPQPVFDAVPIDMLTDLLQGVFTNGTAKSARQMGFDFPAAGKTGTTNNSRDAWFAGYTPALTAVVWVGMDQYQDKPEPNLKSSKPQKSKEIRLTGANSALPIWVKFMKQALIDQPRTEFSTNELLKEVSIDSHTGKLANSGCPATQVVLERYRPEVFPSDPTCEPNWPPSSEPTLHANEIDGPEMPEVPEAETPGIEAGKGKP